MYMTYTARCGGVQVADWTMDGRSGFDSRLSITTCEPSDDNEVGRRLRTPRCPHWVGLAAGLNRN